MTRSKSHDPHLTFDIPRTGETRSAGTGEAIDVVGARGSVLAGVSGAVIHVVLAMGAVESTHTGAMIAPRLILARSSVLAHPRQAVVDVLWK